MPVLSGPTSILNVPLSQCSTKIISEETSLNLMGLSKKMKHLKSADFIAPYVLSFLARIIID